MQWMKGLRACFTAGPGSVCVWETRKPELWIAGAGCGEKGKARRCYFNLAVRSLGNPAEDQAVSAAGRASVGTEGAVDGAEAEPLREDAPLLTSPRKVVTEIPFPPPQVWKMPPSFWATGRRWSAGWAWGALTLGAIRGTWRPARTPSKEPPCCRARTSPRWALLPLRWRWAPKTRTSSRGPRAAPTPAKPASSRANRNRSATGHASPQRSSTSWRGASPRPTTPTSSCGRSWRCASGWPSRECRYTRAWAQGRKARRDGRTRTLAARCSAGLRSRAVHFLGRMSSFSVQTRVRMIDRPQWTSSIVATSTPPPPPTP